MTIIHFIIVLGTAVMTFGLLVVVQPRLGQFALVHPNPRSSHKAPTPQGGGIVIIATTVLVTAAAMFFPSAAVTDAGTLAWVLGATVMLAIVGAVDDFQAIAAVPRLVAQILAVIVVLGTLPAELRIVQTLPWWLERGLLLVGGVWFVNVVNFMDGIDWMTVSEVVPLTAGLALFGAMGALPYSATIAALAICGATIGFAPFNRPVARLFLGDVGSLPIGLLLTWLLILLAGNGHLAAALLLPLYYLADATITLLRRLANGEPILQAHRRHFYQRAVDSGAGIYGVIGRVFIINIALVALATLTVLTPSRLAQAAAVAAGFSLVGLLLFHFARGRR